MSDRYQREIEDLLRTLDTHALDQPVQRRIARRTAGRWGRVLFAVRDYSRRPVIEQLMIGSVLLVLLSLLIGLVPGLGIVAFWTSILGLLLLVAWVAMSANAIRRGRSPSSRGRVVDYRPRSPSLWWRVRRMIRRR